MATLSVICLILVILLMTMIDLLFEYESVPTVPQLTLLAEIFMFNDIIIGFWNNLQTSDTRLNSPH